jgi:tetratricopeptide (TPR) repeat protein
MPATPAARRRSVVPLVVAVAGLSIPIIAAVTVYLARKPNDHWDEVARAKAYLDAGRPDLAFQTVSKIRDEAPGAAEALTLGARALLTRPDVDVFVVRKALERSLKLNPDQAEAAKLLAALNLAEGDGAQGLKLLQHAARLDPNDFRPWFAMGKAYHEMGDHANSAQAYADALRRSPPLAEGKESQKGRIRALLDAHRESEAAAELVEARKQDPDDVELLTLAAREAQVAGRAAEAAELVERVLVTAPDSLEGLYTRAELRFRAGQPEQALEDLEHAFLIDPTDVRTMQLLSQVQSRLGLTDQAAVTTARLSRLKERTRLMDQLTREVSQHPNDAGLRWRLGQAAVEGEKYPLAYQCFRAALDLDPNHKPSREALVALRSSGHAPGLPSMRPPSARAGASP